MISNLRKFSRQWLKTGIVILISVLAVFNIVKATYPTTAYNPGETLNPSCSPGDANCTVTTSGWVNSGSYVYPSSTSWLVGIGTTTPQTALDINGSSTLRGNVYMPGVGSTNCLALTTNGLITTTACSSGVTFPIPYASTTGFTFATSGLSGLSIASSSGVWTFTIATSSATQNGFLSSADWTTFNNKQSTLSFPLGVASTTAQPYYWVNSGTNLYTTSTSWNVGIGTTTPATLFTVATTSNIFNVLSSGNVGIGTTTPSNLLEVLDLISFKNSDWKTSLGYQAGKYDLGQYNTFIGYQAGSADYATGKTNAADENVGIGYQSLYKNTTGARNTALGVYSLISNNGGYYNTAVGNASLYFNVSGGENTALGYRALYQTTGNYNTAVGSYALSTNAAGSNSTAMGYQALLFSTGSNNIAFGYNAGDNISSGANNIVIGYDIDAPSATGSNQLNIGNLIFATGVNGTGTTISTGNVGIGTSTPRGILTVGSGSIPILLATTTTNSVGIGTASPSASLHVASTTILASNIGAGVSIGTTTISNIFTVASSSTGNALLAILGSGNVGIGTTTPATLFTVATTSNIFNVLSSGRIGIGTTTPQAALHIGTASTTQITLPSNALMVSGELEVGGSAYLGPMEFPADSGVISWIDMPISTSTATSTVESYSARLGGTNILTIYGLAAGGAGGITSPSVGIATTTPPEVLTVNGGMFIGTSTIPTLYVASSTGRVGIATSTPYYALDVAGTAFLRGSPTATGLFVNSTGLVGIGTTTPSATLSMVGSSTAPIFALYPQSASTTASFYIASSGYVGISTTTPSDKLDVAGGIRTSGGYSYTANGDMFTYLGGGPSGMTFRNGQAVSTGITFVFPSVVSTGVIYQANGGGVARTDGTAVKMFSLESTSFNPSSGSSDFYAFNITPTINQTGSASGNYVGMFENITETSALGTNNRLMDLQVGGSSKFLVRSSGNVGIGTTTPAYALQIAGSIVPTANSLYSLGTSTLKWSNLYAATTTVGDLVFGNNFRFTETTSTNNLQVLNLKNQNGVDILTIDENGNLIVKGSISSGTSTLSLSDSGNSISAEGSAGSSLLSGLIDGVKQSFASLGLIIEDGITRIKNLITDTLFAKKARIEKLEMVDSATGEIYCTYIENGEWVKIKGECGTPTESVGDAPPPAENTGDAPPENQNATSTPPLENATTTLPIEQPPAQQPPAEEATTTIEQPPAEVQPQTEITTTTDAAAPVEATPAE